MFLKRVNIEKSKLVSVVSVMVTWPLIIYLCIDTSNMINTTLYFLNECFRIIVKALFPFLTLFLMGMSRDLVIPLATTQRQSHTGGKVSLGS